MNLTKIWLFALVCLMMGSNSLIAQDNKTSKDSKDNKTSKDSKDSKSSKTTDNKATDNKTTDNKTTASKDNKTSKDGKTTDNKTTASKDSKVKPAKNGNTAAGIAVQVSGMNRDEKNAMSHCPVHNKHMSLSDNYQAEDNDLPHGDHYPFAYQLSYRRYCEACTNIMLKEAKDALAANKAANSTDTEHCKIHGSKLKTNSDRSKTEYEKNPSADMPHAKQYLLKHYCAVCTKIYKIQNK